MPPVFWVWRVFQSVLPGDVCLFVRRVSRVFGADFVSFAGLVPAAVIGVTCVGRLLVFSFRVSFLLMGAVRIFRAIFVCFVFRVAGAHGFGSRFLRTFDRLLFGVGALTRRGLACARTLRACDSRGAICDSRLLSFWHGQSAGVRARVHA